MKNYPQYSPASKANFTGYRSEAAVEQAISRLLQQDTYKKINALRALLETHITTEQGRAQLAEFDKKNKPRIPLPQRAGMLTKIAEQYCPGSKEVKGQAEALKIASSLRTKHSRGERPESKWRDGYGQSYYIK